jgi:hypothetical protein
MLENKCQARKKKGKDRSACSKYPIVAIHMYMETMLGISLYSYPYLN